jgi:hypothetical protein
MACQCPRALKKDPSQLDRRNTQQAINHLNDDPDRVVTEVKMTTSKSKKNGLWYTRGFESANREDLLAGKESPKQMCQSIGHKFDYSMHRYPKKSADFMRGYWDSIEAQRNKSVATVQL